MKDKTAFVGGKSKARFSALDWLLLPLVGLLTIGIISGTTEWIARKETAVYSTCETRIDGSFGLRFTPNSTCIEKVPEGLPVRYQINSCGHRAHMECGAKPAGIYRIVVIGSSLAFGSRVPWEETFPARLPKQLSRETGHAVEVYNEGILEWGTPRVLASRMNEVLAEQPDLILVIISPWDVENASVLISELPRRRPNQSLLARIKAGPLPQSLLEVIRGLGKQSTAAFWLRHFIFRSQSQLVAATLNKKESAGFLRSDFDPAWRDHLREFDSQFATIAGSAAAAKVPITAVLIPDRAEAAMVWMGTWPEGYDPYKLDRELRSIVRSHGGVYVDILPGFRNTPDPGDSYFPNDGHPDGNGHELISELLTESLIASPIPALTASPNAQSGIGIAR
jgi:hypothetical protein